MNIIKMRISDKDIEDRDITFKTLSFLISEGACFEYINMTRTTKSDNGEERVMNPTSITVGVDKISVSFTIEFETISEALSFLKDLNFEKRLNEEVLDSIWKKIYKISNISK